MVKLEWKMNGRTVPSNRVADELGKSIRQAAIDTNDSRCTGYARYATSGDIITQSLSSKALSCRPAGSGASQGSQNPSRLSASATPSGQIE